MKKIKCPRCAFTNSLESTLGVFYCQKCGAHLKVEKDGNVSEIASKDVRKSGENNTGGDNKRKWKIVFIVGAVMMLAGLALLFISIVRSVNLYWPAVIIYFAGQALFLLAHSKLGGTVWLWFR